MPRRWCLLVFGLLSVAARRTTPEESALVFAACSAHNPSQQFVVLTPGSSGQIKDRASGRCLTAANCSAAGQPAVILAPCAAGSGGCAEWHAVAASAGTAMFELVPPPTSSGGGKTLCRTLNAPVTGGPVAWGATTCDPMARNNQWKLSGLLAVEQGPISCQPNCCLEVAPPPPPPAAPCFASAAAGAARIAAVSVGDNSTAAERFAAQELAEHLGNISGVHIRILRPAQAQGIKHIAVGYYAATQAGLDPTLLTKERLVRLHLPLTPLFL